MGFGVSNGMQNAKEAYAKDSYNGQSSNNAKTINETLLYEVRRILSAIKSKPDAFLLAKAKECTTNMNEIAYKQAESDFFEAHKQITAQKIRQ